MSEAIKTSRGNNVKKSMEPLYNALIAIDQDTTVETLLADPAILKLMEAGKGGFSGEDSFIHVDGNKVARTCAMTGAIFAHDNTNKEVSYFYKNGSYMIGAEIVKANARKAWEADKAEREEALEEQMLEGAISPKEWKEQATAIKSEEFSFTLDEDVKAQLIADFNGYATKEDFLADYNSDNVAPFTDYADIVEALRNPTED